MSSTPETWLLVCPARAVEACRPLIRSHERERPVRVVVVDDDAKPLSSLELEQELDDVRGVLVIGDRRRTPRTALPGPFLVARAGRRVPAGFLPFTNTAEIGRFVQAASEVAGRDSSGPLAFLGQWDDHVRRMVARGERIFASNAGGHRSPPLCWTADRIIRRDLIAALGHGLGLAMYFGHGRPYGWAGYHGFHTRHLKYIAGRPIGAIVSLTCHTANRRNVALSFAEALPLHGATAAVLGATCATRTENNWWWATNLCETVARTPDVRFGELVAFSCPPREEQWRPYRILGDPLAKLAGAPGAELACQRVYAPAPDGAAAPAGYLGEFEAMSVAT